MQTDIVQRSIGGRLRYTSGEGRVRPRGAPSAFGDADGPRRFRPGGAATHHQVRVRALSRSDSNSK